MHANHVSYHYPPLRPAPTPPPLRPRLRKLMYRVVFPMELKLGATTTAASSATAAAGGAAAAGEDAAAADTLYALTAVVVHVGSGPHHGTAEGGGGWQ